MNRLPIGLACLALLLAACSQTTVDTSALPSQSTPPPAVSVAPSPVSITLSETILASPSASASATLSWAEAEFNGAVDGVVAFGGEYVAVGTIDRVPTAWTSADGESWESHAVEYEPPEGDFPGLPGPWMGNLVEHDAWLYAIGGYRGGGDSIKPLGWRSQDGRRWQQIASQSPFYTEGYSVVDLVSGDAGLLALTHGFAELTGGVWLWTPEASWQEVTPQMPATSAGADFNDAAWANGRYVVVGYGSDGSNGNASTWTSSDGRTWETTTEPYPWESNGDPLGVVSAVAPAPGGTWAAFLIAPGRAVGLHSADARSWDVTQDMMETHSGHIHSVVPIGRHLLAVGGADEYFTGQWGGDPGSWILRSEDGRSWHESLRTDDARGGGAIASNGTGVVVFFALAEPESTRGSVLFRARLP